MKIDYSIKAQLTAILEHELFKDLFSRWSGINYLISISKYYNVKIKVLDLKWAEVSQCLNKENLFEGNLFKKIFDELDLPGNDPLSLIIGDYILDPTNKQTLENLSSLGEIASYAFSPFISSISPKLFGAENFSQVFKFDLNIDISKDINLKNLINLASKDLASFIGLVIPNVQVPSLLTKIEKELVPRVFEEVVKNYEYVFCNAAYIFAAITIHSFMSTGWFLDITSTFTNELTDHSHTRKNIKNIFFKEYFENIDYLFFKYLTETFISEHREKQLADLGLIALCQIKNRDLVTFYSANSLRSLGLRIKKISTEISSELPYILCVSRFAHYIKVIGRQKIGLYSNISEFQDYLNSWLLQYVSSDVETPLNLKYKYPLQEAKVEISEDGFLQDNYVCTISLKPHLISAQVSANIVLRTRFLAINKL